MFCPNCGLFVQDGSTACPGCGNEMPIEDTPYSYNSNNTYNAVPNGSNGSSYSATPNSGMASEKSDKKLIIATLIGVAALILTVFFCSALLKNSSKNISGTYEVTMKYYGEDYSFELVISDDTFEYNLTDPTEENIYKGSVSVVGKILHFTPISGEDFSGEYSKSKKTITLESDLGTMVFEKIS